MDDGACLYCKFTYRLKSLGYKSKGGGLRMTYSALFYILMKTFLNISRHGTSSKNNKNKFEKPTDIVVMATTIHYMLYCKIVFNRFHGSSLRTM